MCSDIKSAEEKMFAARLLDKARIAQKTGQVQATDFVSPPAQSLAARILAKHRGIRFEMTGGNSSAERKRIILNPCPGSDVFDRDWIALLNMQSCCPRREYEAAGISHRDFLGALLGTGLKREKLGDIWLMPQGCVAAVAREIAAYLLGQTLTVKGIVFSATEINIEDFAPPLPEGQRLEATVASLRLDALLACGFRTSRSKACAEIGAGNVRVNHQETIRTDLTLTSGDVISCRGKGRVVIEAVGKTTKKGRIRVALRRFF